MTDLEMTRLCAEAMGYRFRKLNVDGIEVWDCTDQYNGFDPLYDDAQLLALARRFPYEFEQSVTEWCNHLRRSESFDLSHYFCERIAEKTHGL